MTMINGYNVEALGVVVNGNFWLVITHPDGSERVVPAREVSDDLMAGKSEEVWAMGFEYTDERKQNTVPFLATLEFLIESHAKN